MQKLDQSQLLVNIDPATLTTLDAAKLAAGEAALPESNGAPAFTQEQIAEFLSQGIRSGVKNGVRRKSVDRDASNRAKHAEIERIKRRAANKAARASRKKNR